MKKILTFIIVFCLSIVVVTIADYLIAKTGRSWESFFGTPEYKKVKMNKPLETQVRRVIIGSRTFYIPMEYLQSDLDKGDISEGVNLIYVLSDYTPISNFLSEEAYENAFHDGKIGHMLIQLEGEKVSIPQMIENRKNNEMMTKYEGEHYGLHKYIDYDSLLHNNIHYDDAYIELDEEGKAFSFITCPSSKKNVPFPGCTHHFSDRNIRYKIYYKKEKFLSLWKEQKRKAIDFINSFEKK